MALFFRFAFSGFKRLLGQYEVSIAVSYKRSQQINPIEAVTLRLLLDDEEKAREIENRAKVSENIENHDS